MVDTTDAWITSRTGIKERHIAAKNQATSDLAVKAAHKAIEDAGMSADAIDLIIVATATPDMFFPSTACFVQKALGIKECVSFDVSAACSGFLFGLETARWMLENGPYETALLIGAEKLSAITNWEDRSTCVLFGDGAGAASAAAASRDPKGFCRPMSVPMRRTRIFCLFPAAGRALRRRPRWSPAKAQYDSYGRQGSFQAGRA